jgi:hypothetical protein
MLVASIDPRFVSSQELVRATVRGSRTPPTRPCPGLGDCGHLQARWIGGDPHANDRLDRSDLLLNLRHHVRDLYVHGQDVVKSVFPCDPATNTETSDSVEVP